ncbi:MAG: hypothetical protein HY721_18690 [Planctomycetes bacterium]|nr:hypothetical protein [Planctomycetota bacterium]
MAGRHVPDRSATFRDAARSARRLAAAASLARAPWTKQRPPPPCRAQDRLEEVLGAEVARASRHDEHRLGARDGLAGIRGAGEAEVGRAPRDLRFGVAGDGAGGGLKHESALGRRPPLPPAREAQEEAVHELLRGGPHPELPHDRRDPAARHAHALQ